MLQRALCWLARATGWQTLHHFGQAFVEIVWPLEGVWPSEGVWRCSCLHCGAVSDGVPVPLDGATRFRLLKRRRADPAHQPDPRVHTITEHQETNHEQCI